ISGPGMECGIDVPFVTEYSIYSLHFDQSIDQYKYVPKTKMNTVLSCLQLGKPLCVYVVMVWGDGSVGKVLVVLGLTFPERAGESLFLRYSEQLVKVIYFDTERFVLVVDLVKFCFAESRNSFISFRLHSLLNELFNLHEFVHFLERFIYCQFEVLLHYGQAYFRQGVALQYLGRHADALAAFASGLAQDPKSLQLLVGMVEAAMKSPMRDTLEPTYQQLQKMKLDKSPFVVVSVVGQELLTAGHHGASVVVLEAALKIGTCSLKLRGSVFSALSSAHWSLGNTEKSTGYMQQDLDVAKTLGTVILHCFGVVEDLQCLSSLGCCIPSNQMSFSSIHVATGFCRPTVQVLTDQVPSVQVGAACEVTQNGKVCRQESKSTALNLLLNDVWKVDLTLAHSSLEEMLAVALLECLLTESVSCGTGECEAAPG
ncbi:hypothetical protein STEG23_034153, partial [Scotinomys teguina]